MELDHLVQRAWRMVSEAHEAILTGRHVIDTRVKTARWTAPPTGTLKLNSDAAVYNDGTTTYGFVVRDSHGEILAAGVK
ncbi:hypothetical protein ACS0TY_023363 [Phlomoides rotata]